MAIVDYRNMTGSDKAAVLLLAIGEDNAAKLFNLMEDEEIHIISKAIANLGSVGSQIVERLFVEFVEQIATFGSLIGSYDTTERMLQKAFDPDRVAMIMEEIRGPAGRTMWEKLANVNEVVLANYLKNEYPQTVAVILSRIKTDHAAHILTNLPENFAMEVIMRMLKMESVQKAIIDDVEKTLKTEFMTNLSKSSKRDSYELMADIFNNLDRTTETRFMNLLEKKNRDSAERIKTLMFTFDDLVKLDPSGIQTLARSVQQEQLIIALKGASDTMKDLFFKNMSERAVKIMREEMNNMGPVRLRAVDEAQANIVQQAKELAANGEITISSGGEEDELIY